MEDDGGLMMVNHDGLGCRKYLLPEIVAAGKSSSRAYRTRRKKPFEVPILLVDFSLQQLPLNQKIERPGMKEEMLVDRLEKKQEDAAR
ncbi:hypothetical protein LXL04_004687 [Taraxacum kok-saghyz]